LCFTHTWRCLCFTHTWLCLCFTHTRLCFIFIFDFRNKRRWFWNFKIDI